MDQEKQHKQVSVTTFSRLQQQRVSIGVYFAIRSMIKHVPLEECGWVGSWHLPPCASVRSFFVSCHSFLDFCRTTMMMMIVSTFFSYRSVPTHLLLYYYYPFLLRYILRSKIYGVPFAPCCDNNLCRRLSNARLLRVCVCVSLLILPVRQMDQDKYWIIVNLLSEQVTPIGSRTHHTQQSSLESRFHGPLATAIRLHPLL